MTTVTTHRPRRALSRPHTRRDGVVAVALSLLILALTLSAAVAMMNGKVATPVGAPAAAVAPVPATAQTAAVNG